MIAFTGNHVWRSDRGRNKIRGEPWGVPVPVISFDKRGIEINKRFANRTLELLETKAELWSSEVNSARSTKQLQDICDELNRDIGRIARSFYKFRGGGKHFKRDTNKDISEIIRKIRILQKVIVCSSRIGKNLTLFKIRKNLKC